MQIYDVAIIGAGAAGLMAGGLLSSAGKSVVILEQNSTPGVKIKISGGGRCNFTNLNVSSENFISNNQHFAKSSLAQFNSLDFIKLVEKHKISYHEKTLGQLFCDHSSSQIINMLLDEAKNARLILGCKVIDVSKSDYFNIETSLNNYTARSLIIASGGLSIPKLGASNFAYLIAKKFGINIIKTMPALVPLIFEKSEDLSDLAGISLAGIAKYKKQAFVENILFTHKGISGPAILQISSYLEDFNDNITINLLHKKALNFDQYKRNNLSVMLKEHFPNRFIDNWFKANFNDTKIIETKKENLLKIENLLRNFQIKIIGSEGYEKAEVTKGGIDTNELSSKTMESKKIPGLYFIGECVDVTGWLGGYNFQWAWSSANTAAKSILYP